MPSSMRKASIPKPRPRPGDQRAIEPGDPVYDPPRKEDIEFKAAWAKRLEQGTSTPPYPRSVLRPTGNAR